VIYDPFSGTSGAGGIVRDPFPNNVVPSNRFDSVGKNVVGLFPAPNATGLAITNANNFFGSGKSTANNNSFDVRVDWARTEKHTFFVRVSKAWQNRMAPRFYGKGVDTGNEGGNPRHHITIGNTFVPSPTFVMNVLLGSGRWREEQYSPCIKDGLCLSSLGFPAALVSPFDPHGAHPQRVGLRQSGSRETHNLQVNATKQFSAHTLKFGASGELQPLYDTDASSNSFSFDRGMTSGPTAATTSTGDRERNRLPVAWHRRQRVRSDRSQAGHHAKILWSVHPGHLASRPSYVERRPASVTLPADTPGAWSSFNALFVDFSRQIGNSLNLSTTYQWSKALDNASESGSFRNVFDKSTDKSVSTHDVPHSFKTAVV
jgi:hypothetical protein